MASKTTYHAFTVDGIWQSYKSRAQVYSHLTPLETIVLVERNSYPDPYGYVADTVQHVRVNGELQFIKKEEALILTGGNWFDDKAAK